MEINGTAVVITGGASGLGAATARLLAHLGAKVAIFDMNTAQGEAVAKEIGGVFFPVNVTDEAQVAAAIARAEEAHGVGRVLVNCAGIGSARKTVDREGKAHPLAGFTQVIAVNLLGTFNVLAKFAARLASVEPQAEGRGVIINTASVAAYDGQIGQAAYAASKAGVVGLTLPVARDLAQLGIRVMTIAPGLFLTPLLQSLPEDAQLSLGAQVPFPSRLGRPEEYAQMVEAIIRNQMLNGETIRLDGAIRMAPR
ncbi:MAG: SDR family NAD(P)-dependent oxidoreductase [Acidocella sp.]|nr:SDR family NAD(P)-dependent oxidoreductase [Acidocella sp.]